VIPALGVYAALRREAGLDLPFPGGAPRVAQAIDADLQARAIAWAGEAASTRNEIFNITNGDVFVWENIWPAIAASLGMGPAVTCRSRSIATSARARRNGKRSAPSTGCARAICGTSSACPSNTLTTPWARAAMSPVRRRLFPP
jgi:hypothetical protein